MRPAAAAKVRELVIRELAVSQPSAMTNQPQYGYG